MAARSNPQKSSAATSKQVRKLFEANKHVLVIEDDKIMGQMVTEILQDKGFEVKTATNGRIALEILQQHPIDFIVLDILLPEMNGFEVYSKLHANPASHDIPVLIITAWADERHIEQAAQAGLRHFLAKPFTEDELLREILSLLRDSSKEV